jgi:hypothetical protein
LLVGILTPAMRATVSQLLLPAGEMAARSWCQSARTVRNG